MEDSTLPVRVAIAVAIDSMKHLLSRPGHGNSDRYRFEGAIEKLQAMLDQQGCKHIEGFDGLCETCDVIMEG